MRISHKHVRALPRAHIVCCIWNLVVWQQLVCPSVYMGMCLLSQITPLIYITSLYLSIVSYLIVSQYYFIIQYICHRLQQMDRCTHLAGQLNWGLFWG